MKKVLIPISEEEYHNSRDDEVFYWPDMPSEYYKEVSEEEYLTKFLEWFWKSENVWMATDDEELIKQYLKP